MATVEANVPVMTRDELREFVEIIVDEKITYPTWYNQKPDDAVTHILAEMQRNIWVAPSSAPSTDDYLKQDRNQ